MPPELDGQICSTAYCVIRCDKSRAYPLFLFHAVASDSFVSRVSAHQRGSSYPAVTDKDVLAELVPCPPLEEQIRIGNLLHLIDGKTQVEEKRRRTLQSMFTSVLEDLVLGKRRLVNARHGSGS